MDGTAAPTLDEAVPGYGEHLVLAQMLSDDVHAVLCVGLDPGVAAVVMAFAEPG